MSGSAIDDKKDRALCSDGQSLQEFDEYIGVDAALLISMNRM